MEVRTAYSFHLLYKHTYAIAVSTALTFSVARSTFISINTYYFIFIPHHSVRVCAACTISPCIYFLICFVYATSFSFLLCGISGARDAGRSPIGPVGVFSFLSIFFRTLASVCWLNGICGTYGASPLQLQIHISTVPSTASRRPLRIGVQSTG